MKNLHKLLHYDMHAAAQDAVLGPHPDFSGMPNMRPANWVIDRKQTQLFYQDIETATMYFYGCDGIYGPYEGLSSNVFVWDWELFSYFDLIKEEIIPGPDYSTPMLLLISQ